MKQAILRKTTAQEPSAATRIERNNFADHSSAATAQRKRMEMLSNSPQTTAQRERLNTLQRVEEEEPLQGKFETAQRIEEEELLQGKFEIAQRVEEEEPLQAKFEAVQRVEEEEPLQGKFEIAQRVEEEEPIQAVRANNTGLPDNLKSGIESLSGMSMDNVKVHYNSSQPAQLQALAYAQGNDIHVGPGQEQHLPHEAWHVVQQRQGRVKPTMQMKGGVPVNDDVGLETEADVMGAKALQLFQYSKNKFRTASNDLISSTNTQTTIQGLFLDEAQREIAEDQMTLKEEWFSASRENRHQDKSAIAKLQSATAVRAPAIIPIGWDPSEESGRVEVESELTPMLDLGLSKLPQHEQKQFIEICSQDRVDPKTVADQIRMSSTSELSYKRGLQCFLTGAPLGTVKLLAQCYEQLISFNMYSISVSSLQHFLDCGLIVIEKDTYKDTTLGAGTVYVFKIRGTRERIRPEWHVHWGPRNRVEASSFKDNRTATGEGARVSSSELINQQMRTLLGKYWGV